MKVYNPSVWVIVLNYCSLEDTLGCVAAVRNNNYPNLHLLVIDNASLDGDGIILKNQLLPTEFLQLVVNTGYAGGNNEGIKRAMKAEADYILILNPDVRLPSNALANYVDILEADLSIGALNPVQVEADGLTIDHKFVNTIFKPLGHLFSSLKDIDLPELFDTNELLGAAILLPRRTLEKIGGFDPLYFAYSEEVDLCRRIRLHGLRLSVTTRSPVKHLRSKENSGTSDFVLFLRLKGICLFKLKDPHTSLSRGLSRALKLLWSGLYGKAADQYPFNRYPIRTKHILKTTLWLFLHLSIARHHRNIERLGRAHI